MGGDIGWEWFYKFFYSTAFQGELVFQETGRVVGEGTDGEGRAGGNGEDRRCGRELEE